MSTLSTSPLSHHKTLDQLQQWSIIFFSFGGFLQNGTFKVFSVTVSRVHNNINTDNDFKLKTYALITVT